MTHAEAIERAKALEAAVETLDAGVISAMTEIRYIHHLSPAEVKLVAKQICDELVKPGYRDAFQTLGGL